MSIQPNAPVPELLDLKKILPYLNVRNRSHLAHTIILPEIDSTNTYLLELAAKSSHPSSICFAESQTQGRGRLGRKWFSPFARNIYLSVLWTFAKPAHELSGLSLSIAVAIATALQRCDIHKDVALKWPNDVLWQKRKLAGVLVEIANKKPSLSQVVIGVGLNVNMPKEAKSSIDQPWIDIAEIINPQQPQRNQIAGLILDELLTTCSIFATQGFGAYREQWQKLDLNYNKAINVMTFTGPLSVMERGVNAYGQLLLETPDGSIKTLSNGEISSN